MNYRPLPAELVIGQVTNSPASRRRADAIDTALGRTTSRYDGPAVEGLKQAWPACDLIISHLALGATTRIIAPLLTSKTADPGVVVIDEAGRFAIPLVGGHGGRANDLAVVLGEQTGATAVLTTATDALGVAAVDTMGWPYHGAVAEVTRALLDGRPVALHRTQQWPLPAFPDNVSEDASDPVAQIVVTDELVDSSAELPTVVLHPSSLVVGMGCNRGTSVQQLRELLEASLTATGLALDSVTSLTSVDVKADEAGLIDLANQLGVPFVTHSAEVLAEVEVPTPSVVVEGHVGTPSVAEAAVLASGAQLIATKQRSRDATCAIGRRPARGHLRVVGLGPGSRDLLTPRAKAAITGAWAVVGYGPYVDQIIDLITPGTKVFTTGMGGEEQRISQAIDWAREGRQVTLVCSGDPAIYAMASPVLEQGTDGIDVTIVPGVTAELAVSALVGAPLGHDHATISLSDLHTDWQTIEHRLIAAAEGDLVTVLYNPRSRTRLMHLPRALEIFAAHRPAHTPVIVVEEAERPGQQIRMAPLAEFDVEWVNMNSLVVIGSSTTTFATSGAGRQIVVTPRDYQWMPGNTAR